jgi:hypothetical protein
MATDSWVLGDFGEKARHFRDLATEVRAKAAMLKSLEALEILGKLAADYDSLAESLERAGNIRNSE